MLYELHPKTINTHFYKPTLRLHLQTSLLNGASLEPVSQVFLH